MKRPCAMLALGLWLLAQPWADARAQAVDATSHFPVQLGSERLSAVALSAVEPRYRWMVGLSYSYSRAPLTGESAGLVSTQNLVSDQHLTELQLVFGLPWVDVGLALPVVIYQLGNRWTASTGQEHAEVEHAAVGDLRLHAKVMLLDPRHFRVGVAVAVDLATPTGQGDRFAGSPTVVFTPRLVLDYWVKNVASVALNVAYVQRSAERLENLVIDDELVLSTGIMFKFGTLGLPVYVWAEVVASTQISDPFGSVKNTPVEGRFGIRLWNSENFFVEIGWGGALVRGDGLPRYRVLVDFGLTFRMPGMSRAPAPPSDRDKDGIPDHLDSCPDQPEDIDGFEDRDGCPEPGTAELSPRDRKTYQRPVPPRWWQKWRRKVAKRKAARLERDARRRERQRVRQRKAGQPRQSPRKSSLGDKARWLGRTIDKVSKTLKRGQRDVKQTLKKLKQTLKRRPRPRRRRAAPEQPRRP